MNHVIYNIEIARSIGDREATILQEIYYWVERIKADKEKFKNQYKDGKFWTWSSRETLSKKYPWSTITVFRILTKLEEDGYILKTHLEGTPFNVNAYTLTEKAELLFDRYERSMAEVEERRRQFAFMLKKFPTPTDEKVTDNNNLSDIYNNIPLPPKENAAPTTEKPRSENQTSGTPTYNNTYVTNTDLTNTDLTNTPLPPEGEPSSKDDMFALLDSYIHPSCQTSKEKSDKQNESDKDVFEQIWDSYTCKASRKGGKKEGIRAYTKALRESGRTPEDMLRAVKRYIEDEKRNNDGAYICGFARFFNGEKYEAYLKDKTFTREPLAQDGKSVGTDKIMEKIFKMRQKEGY